MSASFASPDWHKSVEHLNWGVLFTPLVDDILWVLSTTVANDEARTEKASELALASEWFSNSFVSLCIKNTHKTAAQVPKFIDFGELTEMVMVASGCFSENLQREFEDEVGHIEWPSIKLTQQMVLEIFESAVFNAYIRQGVAHEILCLENEIGSFYVFPKERRAVMEKSLALHA